jgi:type VII secretion integral membrane protein EccD
MDVALPTDLTVAELVPMLTELARESGPRRRPAPPGSPGSSAPASWCLAAAAGAALPPRATLAGLGVLDGDVLRLRHQADAPPPPVFDDPVDAVAEAVRAPDGDPGAWSSGGSPEPLALRPWDERCRRLAGFTAGGLASVVAAALLVAARGLGERPSAVAAVIGALAAGAALTGGMRTVRADGPAGVLLAVAAVPLAAAAGVSALPGTPGAGHLLLATALGAAASAAGLALLGTAAPALVSCLVVTAMAALAALLAGFDIGSAGGLGAGASAIAVGLLPLLPRLSIRLAGLPPPVIPTTPDEMLAADAHWEFASPEETRYQSQLAHTYLAGLVLGASAVASAGAMLAAGTGGWAGPAFAAVVVSVLLLRSRGYVTAAACAAPMVAGLVAATALVGGLALTAPGLARLAGAPALLVTAAVAVWLVRAGRSRESSPVLRRAVDIVEAVLVVATFPLALAVLELYRLVRQL